MTEHQPEVPALLGGEASKGDALSQGLARQRPELTGRVHYVNGQPWCDGINHTTMCSDDFSDEWMAHPVAAALDRATIAAEPSRAGSPAPAPAERSTEATGAAGRDSGPAHKPGPKRMTGRSVAQDCRDCGQRWPCEGSWQARTEAAEAKLAVIGELCREHADHVHLHCPDLGRPPEALVKAAAILAIIGTEGDGRG